MGNVKGKKEVSANARMEVVDTTKEHGEEDSVTVSNTVSQEGPKRKGGMVKGSCRLRTIADCRRFLAKQVNKANLGQLDNESLRAFTDSARVLHKLIEGVSLETGIEEIKRMLEEEGLIKK